MCSGRCVNPLINATSADRGFRDYDNTQSLITGRPPGPLTSPQADCRVPSEEEESLYEKDDLPAPRKFDSQVYTRSGLPFDPRHDMGVSSCIEVPNARRRSSACRQAT